MPGAPRDLVSANGALNRHLMVSPSLRLVVVRMGDRASATFASDLMTRVIAAAPR